MRRARGVFSQAMLYLITVLGESTMSSDFIWSSIRYAGIMIAGFYGVYATVTDFRGKKNGKKVLLPRGYFGIVLLIIASLLGFIADIHKDRQDAQDAWERQKRDAQIADATNKTTHDLSTALTELHASETIAHEQLQETGLALHEVKRLSRPLGPLEKFTLVWFIPPDSPLVASYLKRVHDAGQLAIHAKSGQPLFPQFNKPGERTLARLSEISEITANFIPKNKGADPYLTINGMCNQRAGSTYISKNFKTGQILLTMWCDSGLVERSPGVYSRFDLLGSTLKIELEGTLFLGSHEILPKDIGLELAYPDGTADLFRAGFRPQLSTLSDRSDDLFYVGTLSGKNGSDVR